MRQAKASIPQPQPPVRSRAGQSQEVMKTQIRNPKINSYKPNLQRVLHLHHLHIRDLGQERSLFPVSAWPVTASLKDALTPARQWLTTLISQGQMPSFPQPRVCFLGWALWKVLQSTQQSSERNREMLLPSKIHLFTTLAHCVSVHIVTSAISFFHIPKVKYTIFKLHAYSCASISSM